MSSSLLQYIAGVNVEEKLEDTKGVIIISISQKNRLQNAQI